MRIARLAGIPVRLHWSFLVLAAGFALWSLFDGGVGSLVWTGAGLAALFASVVLHELGHALAARAFGIRTRDITLYPFGGVAALEGLPRSPVGELLVALAGPAVNAALFVLFGGLAWATGSWALGMIAALNGVMGLFNLVPAFPMDGGRVFRALLTFRLGRRRATELAIGVGRLFGWAFIVGGAVAGWLNLVVVGGFLLLTTAAEARRERRLEALRRTDASPVRWVVQPTSPHPYRPRWRLDPR